MSNQKRLWEEFEEEILKVKRAISMSLFDVTLAPLERAKAAIKILQRNKEPNLNEKIAEIEELAAFLYKKLKIKKLIAPNATKSDEEKLQLRRERDTAIDTVNKVLDEQDFGFAIFNLKKAKEVSEKLGALHQDEQTDISTKIKESNYYFQKGLKFYKEKSISKALGLFWRAIDINPENIDVWSYLLSYYTRIGDSKNAKLCEDRINEILNSKNKE